MVRIISIVNQKGGSGKTTTTVNLGATLAEKGKKILLIDLDPQSSTSLWYGYKDQGKAILDALTTNKRIEDTVVQTNVKGVDIICSSPVLSNIEKILINNPKSELVLRNKLNNCEKEWDYILIDCPPTLGVLVLNALSTAKEVLVPVVTHVMALHGLVQLMKTINHIKERVNKDLEITGILPCRVDFRTRHSHEVIQQLRKRFDKKVYKSIIRENIKLAEAPLYKKPIIHYEKNCHGSYDYRALATELIKQEKLYNL